MAGLPMSLLLQYLHATEGGPLDARELRASPVGTIVTSNGNAKNSANPLEGISHCTVKRSTLRVVLQSEILPAVD